MGTPYVQVFSSSQSLFPTSKNNLDSHTSFSLAFIFRLHTFELSVKATMSLGVLHLRLNMVRQSATDRPRPQDENLLYLVVSHR